MDSKLYVTDSKDERMVKPGKQTAAPGSSSGRPADADVKEDSTGTGSGDGGTVNVTIGGDDD